MVIGMKKNVKYVLILIISIFFVLFISSCNKVSTKNLGKYFLYDNSRIDSESYLVFEEDHNVVYMSDSSNDRYAVAEWTDEGFLCYLTGDLRIKMVGKFDNGKLIVSNILVTQYSKVDSVLDEDFWGNKIYNYELVNVDNVISTLTFYKEGVEPELKLYYINYLNTLTGESIVHLNNATTNMPVLQSENMYFAGWYLTPLYLAKVEEGMPINGDVVLYSKWEELNDDNSCVISFDTDGGEEIEPIKIPKGGKFELPIPKKNSGYFVDWYLDAKYENRYSGAIYENTTLYAKFDPAYNLTFLDYDGSLILSTQIRTNGISAYSGKTPERPDDEEYSYVFKGWDKPFGYVHSDETFTAVYDTYYKSEDGLIFDLSETKDYYTLIGNKIKDDTKVVVPELFKGLPVKKIVQNALSCPNALEIIIPDSIEEIEEGALNGCKKLKNIKLPFVGGKAIFEENTYQPLGYIFGTKEVDGVFPTEQLIKNEANSAEQQYKCYIPNTLETVEVTKALRIYKDAFYYCDRIKNVILNEAKVIDYYAFCNCMSLENIEFKNVETISYNAFEGCGYLESITLPNSLKVFNNNMFYNCNNLTKIFASIYLESYKNYFYKEVKLYCMGEGFIQIEIKATNTTIYYLTENKEAETRTGNWYYYDDAGILVEKINP